MRTVMALAFLLYLLWTVLGVFRTAPPGRMNLALTSLGAFVLLSPLVWVTVQQSSGEEQQIYPIYEWIWLGIFALSGVLALLLRRHPARWTLWGIAASGLCAYLFVTVLFELGVSPPLDLAP